MLAALEYVDFGLRYLLVWISKVYFPSLHTNLVLVETKNKIKKTSMLHLQVHVRARKADSLLVFVLYSIASRLCKNILNV